MKRTRRCDARCHNAKGKRCTCWCGGLYHGVGHKKAVELFKIIYDDYDSRLLNINGECVYFDI